MSRVQPAPMLTHMAGAQASQYEAFAWADNIVSIGFSFPDQDAYFVDCIANGLPRNGSDRISLHLVDRNGANATELRRRLLANPGLRILGQPKFRVIAVQCAGFDEVEVGIENIPEILGADGKPV